MNVAVVSAVTKRRRKASKRFCERISDATPFPGITHTSKAMEEHDPARKRPCATVAVRAHDQGNVVRLDRQSPHGGGWDKSDDP
jgi:hypothetical protein